MKALLLVVILAASIHAQNLYQVTIDQDALAGAPDFSYLNHPLTSADRISVRNGHFYTDDGKRVRLFGVNLAFGANFPEPNDAPRIAKRLRKLGVNLVRLHHMDSNPDRDPNTANSVLTTGPYPTLNPVSIARLRNFLNALRAEGIYADLNLHVGYTFRPAVDKVPEIAGGVMPTQSKPLHIFYPRMVELQVEFTRKLISALALRDDPVLAMVEIDNETSLVHAWETNQLRAVTGEYREELERQWKATGDRHSKGEEADPNEWLVFLVDRDRHYLQQMLHAIRDAVGPRVPVAGTQMGYGGLLNLWSHQDTDYDDHHFYIDHYNFPGTPWDQRDWRIRDASSVGSGFTTFVNIAAARTAGRPFTVSEFNEPWPNTHAAEIDPELAAFGAFQDWDAIMHFAYSHGRNWDDGAPNGFNINGDWSKFVNIGQSAWLFRSGAIQPSSLPLDIPISQDLALRSGREKRNGNIAPFLKADSGYDPYVAFTRAVRLVRDGAAEVKVATPLAVREITYDAEAKVFLIHAPMAAGVFGFVQKKATAGAITVERDGFTALLLTSLDGKPLTESAHMLLSTPGYTLRSQRAAGGQGIQGPQKLIHYGTAADWWTLEPEPDSPDKPSGSMARGVGPVWMERVDAYLTLESKAKSLTVYALDGKGSRLAALPNADIERLAGRFRIDLESAPWYELIAR